MATGSRAAFILERWQTLVNEHLISECGAGNLVGTTFTLYRRTLTGTPNVPPSRDDLGLQARPTKQDFTVVVADLPCLFVGTSPKTDRWHVHPEGQDQQELANLVTAYLDVREGDNVVVALDGKTYAVEASTRLGPLVRCFLDTATAQL